MTTTISPNTVFLTVVLTTVTIMCWRMFFQRSRDRFWVNCVLVGIFLAATTGLAVTGPSNAPTRQECRFLPKSTWHKYTHCIGGGEIKYEKI